MYGKSCHLCQASKDTLNKNILRCYGNVRYDDADLIVAGNAFHALAAATVNALSPSVIRRVGGTRSVDVEPERRRAGAARVWAGDPCWHG